MQPKTATIQSPLPRPFPVSEPFLWCWKQERLHFLPERALWRDDGRMLMVADLHLGKAETFQAQGIPLPSDGDAGTLNPLLELCHRWKPRRLLILGDLIHSRLGVTNKLREVLRALPNLIDADVDWIGGNHDRRSWLEGLPQQPSQRIGGLWLSHEPDTPPDDSDQPLLNICGHIHPMGRIHGGGDHLRLPCFAYEPNHERLIIPAFGELTGGHDCDHRYCQWLVADGTIVPWLSPSRPNRARASA